MTDWELRVYPIEYEYGFFYAVFCYGYIDGLVQDCSNSIANALELLQSCTKPLVSFSADSCGLYTCVLQGSGPENPWASFDYSQKLAKLRLKSEHE